MELKKRITILFISLAVLLSAVPRVSAETVSVEELLAAMPAKSIVACECTTGRVLMEKSADETVEISHLAKLMLLLLAAEKLESGELHLEDTVTASAKANSMPAPQIWLDKNEKISVEELIKALTVGNANDAAVALAEHIFGSAEAAVEQMNSKAETLDMRSTTYADVCGINERTLSTAEDTAKLAGELVKHDILTLYFTSRIEYVRGDKAELVNLNRLVRNYKGITGLKACSSSAAGECSVVTARRRDMDIAVVILGCDKRENCDDMAKKLLDMCFDSYSLYTPEPDEKMLEKIPVKGGEKLAVKVTFGELAPAVIPKGSSYSFDIDFEKESELTAPVKKGQVCGKLTCRFGEEEMYSAELVAAEPVKQKSFPFCLKQLVVFLLKI
ncbi:serine hydrolase [Ruminococcus sp.]|uniref:D-alanyl-D-alanine carboxypeptidase family protein n=1 Tax=Ruminococcus sp. TaxID=41978 RepID=UPI0025EBEF08|nr:serine hydrolase [Ruminococcus sp.]MBQ8967852.1 D-alanyl-D-alanine carboxypeptidase [Ruminococcus sp.]